MPSLSFIEATNNRSVLPPHKPYEGSHTSAIQLSMNNPFGFPPYVFRTIARARRIASCSAQTYKDRNTLLSKAQYHYSLFMLISPNTWWVIMWITCVANTHAATHESTKFLPGNVRAWYLLHPTPVKQTHVTFVTIYKEYFVSQRQKLFTFDTA